MVDLDFKYKKLTDKLKAIFPDKISTAIILGSGLGNFVKDLNIIQSITTSSLQGFPEESVKGHQGKIHLANVSGKNVLIFQGRLHFYEGYTLSQCILPVHIANQLGAKNIIITNAAGGINRNYSPGDLVLCTSFNSINIKKELTELLGLTSIDTRNNFLNLPSDEMNEIFRKAAGINNITLKEGVYWYGKGPSYETPAEIQMISRLGGDVVGMSSVYEASYAGYLGMPAAIISCVTNMASGISQTKLTHDDVIKTACKSSDNLSKLLISFLNLI